MKKTIFKKLYWWVAGALLLLLTFVFPAVRADAAVTADDVSVNYSQELAAVKKNGNATLYYAVVKAGAEPKNYVPAYAETASYDFGGAKVPAFLIDLSAVNFKKPMSLYVKYGNEETPVKIDLGIMSEFKASFIGKTNEANNAAVLAFYKNMNNFNSETGYLVFTVNGNPFDKPEDITWRTNHGLSVHTLDELDLNLYSVAGTTLYFKLDNGEEPISKEAKVKVKKLSKAPAVKIDGNKMFLAIKGNMEYRVTTGGTTSKWYRPAENAKNISVKNILGLDGDGFYKNFSDATIEVRIAATEKARASMTSYVKLYAVEKPETGANVLTVNHVDVNKPEKGLKISNISGDSYQVAVVKKGAWDTATAADLIKKIDGTVAKTDDGYVEWITVKAGKSVTIAYKKYKDFPEYLILYRRTSVAENKKTAETEFRVASVVKVLSGSEPVASPAAGAIEVNKGQTVTKTITFTVDAGVDLYTSLNGASFTKNTAKSVTFTAKDGETVTIKAYTKDPVTNDTGETRTFIYRLVSGGELDCYKEKWGYNLCILKDAEDGTNGRKIMYQRVYLAYLTYEEEVYYGDLEIKSDAMLEAFNAVRIDNPELIQASGGGSYSPTTLTLKMRDKELCDRLLGQCNTNVEEIKALILEKYGSTATKVQKTKVIHDYLVLKKEYADSDLAQTMAGSLSDEYSPVCMSYALAFKYVCNCLGIQCEMVFGNATNSAGKTEAHAWNMVNYGENVDYSNADADFHPSTWYEMDLTWDDPTGAAADFVRWDYFNLTTEQINKSRVRTTPYYDRYPVENCTGTDLSYANCIRNHLLDELN